MVLFRGTEPWLLPVEAVAPWCEWPGSEPVRVPSASAEALPLFGRPRGFPLTLPSSALWLWLCTLSSLRLSFPIYGIIDMSSLSN